MNRMTKYAILLGYGRFDRSNVPYRRYVDSFASFVNKNAVDTIILAGGYTDKTHPKVSEAESVFGYLQPLLKRDVGVIFEEKSLTTKQNIEFCKKFINLKGGDAVTVFCDNVRPPKVMWFILHYWFDLSKVQIEQYFVDYGQTYYSKNYTTEMIGNEVVKGLKHGNVTIKPFRMRTKIEAAIGQEIPTLLEINTIYDKSLDKRLMREIKIRFGLIRP